MNLYECNYTITYLCLAENEREAQEFIDDARQDDLFQASNVEVRKAKYFKGEPLYPDDWDEKCLVYHNGKGDITAEEAFNTYKPKE